MDTKEAKNQVEEPDVLRAMRLGHGDEKIFWFRDDLHNPYPVTPFGMSTVHRGHMWGYALSAEKAKLPPSRGAVIKTHKGRVYLGFVGITDPKEIETRAKAFGPFIQKSMDEWDIFYGNAMKEGEYLTVPNVRKELGGLSFAQLGEHLRNCERVCRRCWYLHFLTMYVADTVYMGGEEFAKKYGLEEKDYAMMLKGFETKGMASDRGQFLLAKSAMAKPGVIALLEGNEPIDVVMEKTKNAEGGQEWWSEVRTYLNEFGHRSTAAILDVNFPTWYEDPTPVVENIRNTLPKLKGGWDFEEERENTVKLREKAVEGFRKKLKPEDKNAFDKGLPQWQQAYTFNEDHWFYFEQVSWSGLRYAAMEAGRKFVGQGILEKAEDVFYLTYEEILETLESCEEALDVASYGYSHLLRPLVAYRKKLSEQSETDKGPAFVGVLPDQVQDPIAIKVFGLTGFVLDKARKEMAGETVKVGKRIEGFPGAPGEIQGPARVIIDHKDFPKLKTGDILVCPYTSPAWTPIFPKIKGVVTDSGGMLTHAAITAREYGIPAVVGTWVATTAIKDGDVIRIDGTNGVVEIM
jgi:pyruvate,water dikinase